MTNTEAAATPSITPLTVPVDRAIGSIFGLAYGDAIGDPVEFRKFPALKGRVGVPARLRITDDTQMSLAVWYALDEWDPESGLGMLRLELAAQFLAWRVDPDNNRAPGTTCLSSLDKLETMGVGRWTMATSEHSAGCGSVMRAAWVGLHPKVTDETLESVAMLQAVLTHGPAENAFCAAALASLTRALARGEVAPGGCAEWLQTWVDERSGAAQYDEAALSNLWRLTRTTMDARGHVHTSPDEFVDEGLGHVAWVAATAGRLASALREDPWGFDPATISGEGWRAREAVAMAVGVLDGFVDVWVAPEDMLVRAAETSGDSDSTAAITGALVGAALGDVWPSEFVFRLENRYRTELTTVVARLKG